ncbi:hypothetical protein OIU79_011702 [Salix purpurea]|uniref:Uncharacterized protein n=1 Tax=Salix purpurea TaxID=77065 RepID=A0A9Q0Q1R9_SALPP|nr:hypothetical protein OIU79_011702 [Salix purpurea]
MAVLSTTTTVYISRQNFCKGASKNSNVVLTSVASFASKQRGFYIRSSSDGAAETAATESSSRHTDYRCGSLWQTRDPKEDLHMKRLRLHIKTRSRRY